MKFLKLTANKTEHPVWINFDLVDSMQYAVEGNQDQGTYISSTDGTWFVKESINLILTKLGYV